MRNIEKNAVKWRKKQEGGGKFGMYDELAVAVALRDDIVTSSFITYATVELNGEHTRGQVVIDWLKRSVPKHKVKVVTEVNKDMLFEMLIKTAKGEF